MDPDILGAAKYNAIIPLRVSGSDAAGQQEHSVEMYMHLGDAWHEQVSCPCFRIVTTHPSASEFESLFNASPLLSMACLICSSSYRHDFPSRIDTCFRYLPQTRDFAVTVLAKHLLGLLPAKFL